MLDRHGQQLWWRCGRPVLLAAALIALLVVPRVVALDADTWPDLAASWDSGIWTDEGFYTHNARNAVLFGQAELDEFNNRNLSPVLDAVQRAVFRRFGVGLVPARAISVVAGLLALGFFFDALRRIFGWRVGVTALLLLGGEVSFILYNRLALMETPAVLVLCAALWAFVVGRPLGWLAAGVLAVGSIAIKTSFLLFVPIPILAWLWRWADGDRGIARPLFWYGSGAVGGAALYLLFWGLPHRAEIWRMNNYYRTRQVQPRSVPEAYRMGMRALFTARSEGLLQRLETRTPVLTALTITGLLAAPWARRARRRPLSARAQLRRDTLRVLWLWTALGLLFLAVARYAPTRYYLVAYPGMAGLAAATLWRLVPIWRWARRRGRQRWWAFLLASLPAFLLCYHLLLPGMKALGVARFEAISLALGALLATALTGGVVLRTPRLPRPQALAAGVLILFLAVSYGQWSYWYATRGYETRALAGMLARIVGPGELLAGDWAPNLCLENTVRTAPVLPGLANWRDPVRTLGADYVMVGQTPYPRQFWQKEAPEVVRPENLVRYLRLYQYRIALYRVPHSVRHQASAPPARQHRPGREAY